MIQRLARWLSGVGLHWFYSDVRVIGAIRIPSNGPLLIAMNHQNALIDAMLALCIVPRDLRLTAKATLGDSVFGALLLKAVGVIQLRRSSDESGRTDPIRNRGSFEAMINELRSGGAVLVFPEGKSHNDPELAPLKTGLARTALRARNEGVTGTVIIPIGITFENKAEPDTTVVARVGDPIAMDDWTGSDPRELTEAIATALRAISLTGDVQPSSDEKSRSRNVGVRLLACWGYVMHEVPLRIARHQAVRRSTEPDEPAMYTMAFGIGAVLISYLIEVPVVWLFFGWVVALVFLASLIVGGYWTAYA